MLRMINNINFPTSQQLLILVLYSVSYTVLVGGTIKGEDNSFYELNKKAILSTYFAFILTIEWVSYYWTLSLFSKKIKAKVD